MPEQLERSQVLITGATSEIGIYLIESLLKESFSVMAISRQPERALQAKIRFGSRDSFGITKCDLTKQSDLEGLENKLLELAPFKHVVHLAGANSGDSTKFGTPEEFDGALGTNLYPAMLINNVLMNLPDSQRPKHIIHVSSLASIENSGSKTYAWSKKAINSYVQIYGKEFLAAGTMLTGILPGRIKSAKSPIPKNGCADLTASQVGDLILAVLDSRLDALAGRNILADYGYGNVII